MLFTCSPKFNICLFSAKNLVNSNLLICCSPALAVHLFQSAWTCPQFLYNLTKNSWTIIKTKTSSCELKERPRCRVSSIVLKCCHMWQLFPSFGFEFGKWVDSALALPTFQFCELRAVRYFTSSRSDVAVFHQAWQPCRCCFLMLSMGKSSPVNSPVIRIGE